MRLLPVVHGAIVAQIGRELYAERYYRAMANWADRAGWDGLSKWLKVASREERDHSQIFMGYLNDHNEVVDLSAVPAPPVEYKDVPQVLGLVLEHERQVTAAVVALAKLALDQQDLGTQALLAWFVKEQVDGEKDLETLVAQVGRMDLPALVLFDERIGESASYSTPEIATSYGVL